MFLSAAWRVRPVWAIERSQRLSTFVLSRDRAIAREKLVGREHRSLFDHVGVDEEVFQPVRIQDLFDAGAHHHRFRWSGAVEINGIAPFAAGAIRTLRQPYAARTPSEKALVGFHSHAHLRLDGSVRPQ